MPQTVPSSADELRAAAKRLRAGTFRGAITATPTVAGLVAAREPLALLLEAVASNALETDHEECSSWCSPQTCDLSAAVAVARAINGGAR
jgi:hypothetical protein